MADSAGKFWGSFPCEVCATAAKYGWVFYAVAVWGNAGLFHPGHRGPPRRLPYGDPKPGARGLRPVVVAIRAWLRHLQAVHRGPHVAAQLAAARPQGGASSAFYERLFQFGMEYVETDRPYSRAVAGAADARRVLARLCESAGLDETRIRELLKARKRGELGQRYHISRGGGNDANTAA